jgi:hypothetical protein
MLEKGRHRGGQRETEAGAEKQVQRETARAAWCVERNQTGLSG